MKVRTNVKLNLGLSVLRRRPDGYHDLETLFVPYVGFGDELEIVEAPEFSADVRMATGFSVEVTALAGGAVSFTQGTCHPGAPFADLPQCGWDPLKDLTVRAYELLRADFGLPPVAIRLLKGAPVGAGLGGGSADGAFALRMLSDLFGLGLSDSGLAAYAARLGSDCPFFIYNRPMLGEGRGEILTPFEIDLSGYDIRVTVPAGISVSTREAYSGVKPREDAVAAKSLKTSGVSLTPSLQNEGGDIAESVEGQAVSRHARPLTLREALEDPVSRSLPPGEALEDPVARSLPLREALARPVEEWRHCLLNDFEPSVFAAHPELAALKESFYDQGAVYAAMSGSGSAIFGLWKKI